MLLYQIENKSVRPYAVVLGVGIVEPGKKLTFTSDEAAGFERQIGLKLNQGNLQDGLELTVAAITDGGDK